MLVSLSFVQQKYLLLVNILCCKFSIRPQNCTISPVAIINSRLKCMFWIFGIYFRLLCVWFVLIYFQFYISTDHLLFALVSFTGLHPNLYFLFVFGVTIFIIGTIPFFTQFLFIKWKNSEYSPVNKCKDNPN